MMPITQEEGQILVRVARDSVERLFSNKGPRSRHSVQSNVQAGVFVSIHDFSADGSTLRGCVGFPLPRGEFYSSLKEAAVAAATQDPRFMPISKEELDKVIFEVSVMNRPELIKVANPADYLDAVKVGVDGLMLSWGENSSLLLPQVAAEFNWSVDEYLANLCYKAGLRPDMWMHQGAKIYKFSCSVYSEAKPRGEIYRVDVRTFE